MINFFESGGSLLLSELLEGMRNYLIDARGLEVAERVMPRKQLMRVRELDLGSKANLEAVVTKKPPSIISAQFTFTYPLRLPTQNNKPSKY